MKLLSFGEILWDIVGSREYLGGAPFNLAAHAAIYGADCALVSSIGGDDRGREALIRAEKLGVDCRYTQISDEHPTGTVDVIISAGGQPDYIIHEPVAYDFIALDDESLKEIAECGYDVFCFGLLAQRNRTTRDSLMRLLAELGKGSTKIFCDVNLRQNYFNTDILESSLTACDILKLNDEEVKVISKLFNISDQMSIEDFCWTISRQMEIKDIIVTMSGKGSFVFDGKDCHLIEGEKIEVVNTVGAGDAFSAVFLCEKLAGNSSLQAGRRATRVAAFVCTQSGAIPEMSDNKLKGELYNEVIDGMQY